MTPEAGKETEHPTTPQDKVFVLTKLELGNAVRDYLLRKFPTIERGEVTQTISVDSTGEIRVELRYKR